MRRFSAQYIEDCYATGSDALDDIAAVIISCPVADPTRPDHGLPAELLLIAELSRLLGCRSLGVSRYFEKKVTPERADVVIEALRGARQARFADWYEAALTSWDAEDADLRLERSVGGLDDLEAWIWSVARSHRDEILALR